MPDRKPKYFKLKPSQKSPLLTWFDAMHLPVEELRARNIFPISRGDRAILRRADTIEKILLSDAFRRLWFSLKEEENSAEKISAEDWAVVASVLANLKANDEDAFAVRAGKSEKGGDRPAVHPLRFQQLLAARDTDELLKRLRRQLPLIDSRCHVCRLADDLLAWQAQLRDSAFVKNDERIPIRWALAYYPGIPETLA